MLNLVCSWPGVFLAFFLLIAVGYPQKLLLDPGPFWHIRVGEWMLDHGRALTLDPFSISRQGQEWLPTQWLAEIFMALAYRAAGFPLVILVSAAIASALLAFLAQRFFKARLNPAAVWFFATFAFLGISDQLHARPLLVTLVGTACLTAFLLEIEEGKWQGKALLFSFPLAVFWANCHGGYLGAVAMVWLAWFGWGFRKTVLKDGPFSNRNNFLFLTLGALAWTLAPLVSPFGYSLPMEWLRIWFQLDLSSYIIEHLPPSLGFGSFRVVLLLGALLLFLLIRFARSIPFSTVRFMPIAWFYMALQRGRNSSLFTTCGAVVLADLLEKKTSRGKWFTSWSVEKARPPDWAGIALAVMVPLAFSLAAWTGHYSPKLEKRAWATDLIAPLQKLNKNSRPGTGIYNELSDGGFLILHAPNLRVFNDDRCELYGSAWQLEQVDWERNRPWEIHERSTKTPFSLAFVRKETALHKELMSSPKWTLLEDGEIASIFSKKIRR